MCLTILMPLCQRSSSVSVADQFELYHSLLVWNRFFAILTYIRISLQPTRRISSVTFIFWHLRNALSLVFLLMNRTCTPSNQHIVSMVSSRCVLLYTISLSILFLPQLQWRGNWWPILYLCLQARSASTSSFRSLSQVHTKIIIQIYIHIYIYIVERLVY